MYMTTDQIREAYLKFFEKNGHTIVRSSSLVPYNDPTLLFTNAGMNQFKDIYLGKEKRDYVRATTAQKCVRAGGKQNDLDNVGYTARHHTFFEMLGNFSFGDYFKKEAIVYAWTLLTEVYKLPKESLMVTVYDKDDEAYNIWKDVVGVPEHKIVRIGDNKGGLYESDNFWQMGDTGPCGPCSEIFYDHGEDVQGGPPGSPDEDGDRFIEIWNIVFMQFNRQADGTFLPLAKPMIDNGLGLERIAAVLQGVHNNYDIDLFVELEKEAASVLGVTDLKSKSLRVISDHIRSCSFLIADGVLPSNEGRGYVLRRIIRRAVRHGRLLGAKDVFFYKLVNKLGQLMGKAYPELVERRDLIERTLKKEEEQFLNTLDRGLNLLESELLKLGDSKVIPGDVVFKLYDTYGFPADLTGDVVRDRGYTVDMEGFDKCMAEQRARAKSASTFGIDYNKELKITENTVFTGYDTLNDSAKITHIFKDGEETDEISTDEKAVIVLDKTPFYGEMGGQIGDKGIITIGDDARFIVEDTKHVAKATIHVGRVDIGIFKKNDTVNASVDKENRADIARHHSATHLLDAALRFVIGDSVAQKGSFVANDRLRFDYSTSKPLTADEKKQIADLVNAKIQANLKVETQIMDLDDAKKSGAIALFDEKYDEKVRVVSMGDFSKELCGGTHTFATGDLGAFVLLSDESIASGIRRIEALVGKSAIEYLDGLYDDVAKSKALFKLGNNASVSEKVSAVLEHTKALEKENESLKEKIVALECASLINQAHDVKGVTVISAKIDNYTAKELRVAIDNIKSRMSSYVAVLGSASEGRVSLIAAVSKDLTDKVKAGALVGEVAKYVGGKGGGRPDMAQAGGTDVAGLDKAISAVDSLVSDLV
ncbi:MAG: alanine--tRNA ligase [Succinivibrio sp.]|uniref:Alanine--tRNA ligase n=1 Tax=Succinivibrio faecicola TaxID=2820300 RepID=A0ABS7DH53_9GAMM|nr:alanine--tRNA ligase [Succinivibrio faecicola]MBW7570533.1 alanine--tRNA ligase [Succinivibrio faecicola]MCI6938671.1 alanine--tRNA ligase [Succinatimonas hippei]